MPRAGWEKTLVGDCMLPIDATTSLREDEPLLDAISDLHENSLDRALVVHGADVVGLLSITDVGRLLARR